MLRPTVGGERIVAAEGSTLRELIYNVDRVHPGFAGQLLDETSGSQRRFVNIYVNDEDVRYLSGLETPVAEGDVVSILPAVAGGTLEAVRVKTTIEHAIGNTPLVELPSFSPREGVRIWAKLEGANPSGSVKDRIALAMLDEAEARGQLFPGTERVIIEPTSGNTGISLAMLARRRGYRFLAVLPENVSIERRQLLELYGASLEFTPAKLGSNGSIRRAQELVRAHPDRFFMPYQYGNDANPGAHYMTTAPEILRDLPEITHFVAGLGTGGTLTGTGRRLKEEKPSVQVIAAEPNPGDAVQGLRSLDEGFIPPVLDPSVLDRKILVTSDDSLVMTRRLAAQEGVFAGVSSGAVLHAALRVARSLERGEIVCLFADGGWKYLSLGVWGTSLDEARELVRDKVWW
jgi:[CysO sulfur-carrier protein]-thiocarboxylate-dependent cysteine synthase